MTDLLAKTAELFSKEFLFRSFLPALFFSVALITTGLWVVSIEDSNWYESVFYSLAAKKISPPTAIIALIVFIYLWVVVLGYTITGFKHYFFWFWCGNAEQPLIKQFFDYRREKYQCSRRKKLKSDVDASDILKQRKAKIELSVQFDEHGRLAATKLGNIVECYSHYALRRYNIEPDVLWPRLRMVIPRKRFQLLEEQWILLDFLIAMASLALIYSFLALLGAAIIAVIGLVSFIFWFCPFTSISMCSLIVCLGGSMFAAISAYLFYRMTISVALDYGKVFRSLIDLHRLDVLRSMNYEIPQDFKLSEERTKWKSVNELIVYGKIAE